MRKSIHLLASLIVAAAPLSAQADFYLVVQADNPQHALTQKEAVDLFMGRTRAFSNGEFAQVYDLARSEPTRESFYYALTGLSQAQVNSFWSRLQFSGRNLPPEPLASEAAMVATIERVPNAIGWLNHEPSDHRLRTVLILKGAR